MRTPAWALMVCGSLALGTAFADAPAAPDDSKKKETPAVSEVKAEIIVLHATNEGKGSIDPAIGSIPELGEPPFSSYNTYKLLKKGDLKLPKGEAKDFELPNKDKLSVLFKDIAKGKKRDDPMRYLVGTKIKKADGSDFLPGLDVSALKGKYFFIAGQKFKGGILVIGIKIAG